MQKKILVYIVIFAVFLVVLFWLRSLLSKVGSRVNVNEENLLPSRNYGNIVDSASQLFEGWGENYSAKKDMLDLLFEMNDDELRYFHNLYINTNGHSFYSILKDEWLWGTIGGNESKSKMLNRLKILGLL